MADTDFTRIYERLDEILSEPADTPPVATWAQQE
jgi:hypothetical protein